MRSLILTRQNVDAQKTPIFSISIFLGMMSDTTVKVAWRFFFWAFPGWVYINA